MIGRILLAYREKRKLGVRGMAAEIGISHSTLSRIERGFPMDADTMLKLIKWQFAPVK